MSTSAETPACSGVNTSPPGRGYVRRTRSLGERTIALLRFVCLRGKPDRPWRARWENWNESCREGLAVQGRAGLHDGLPRGEFQLTGMSQGLAPFYERAAFLQETDPEAFQRLLEAGDRGALNKARRRHRKHVHETLKRFKALWNVIVAPITDPSLAPTFEQLDSWGRDIQTGIDQLTDLLEARARQLEAEEDEG